MTRFTSNTGTLQWIDHRVGVLVCAALTRIRHVADTFRSEPTHLPRSVLFIKLAEQGSTVLAYDMLRQAVARFGRENVFFLVFEENRFILDLLDVVPPENVFALRTHSAPALATSCARALRRIRRRRIDACVDMEFFARSSAALAFLSGARTRVGLHAAFGDGPYRGDLFTHRPQYNPHQHTSATFLTLLHALEVNPATLPTHAFTPVPEPSLPAFVPATGEQDRVRARLQEKGFRSGSRLFLLNANAGDLLPQRRWAATNYVELAQRLLAAFPEISIVFTGSVSEANAIASLVRDVDSPRCISFAGATTLRELLVLYTLAEVLVTNDSGPAHFAALTPIDVIALFGPETPHLFAALGPRSHPLWASLACSPCVNAYNNRRTGCRDNQCMKAHKIDAVFVQAARIYCERIGAPIPAP